MPKIEDKIMVSVRVMVRIDIPDMYLPEVTSLQEELMALLEGMPQARLEVSMLPVTETRD